MTCYIKRALVSVSDKTELENLSEHFKKYDVEILSTGGTAVKLRDLGLDVKDVSQHTNSPEIMDGRVKTLHPKIHGGLLACLDNEEHLDAMREHNIPSIDLVIVNLYPFQETVEKGAEECEVIENIDIGGPSMLRSAAKNYAFTTVITDTEDYAKLIDEMNNNDGGTTLEFRKQMAAKAFSYTAAYDAAISTWFAHQQGDSFPQILNITAKRKQALRYGENPHQNAAFYSFGNGYGIANAKQLQGKELSYNNINDADAVLQLISEFDSPAAVIVKHANPCGVAVGESILEAYEKALASDPVSAFGGIMAFNRTVDLPLAEKISSMFVEAVITPGIDKEASDLLSKKKNLRVLLLDDIGNQDDRSVIKSVTGGLLVQANDVAKIIESDLEVVTKRRPTDEEIKELLFAYRVCKYVKSNAIVLAKNQATIGIGAGQMSRVDSSRIAVIKASDCKQDSKRAKGSVLASDAFFPFADGVIQAAEAGVVAIIQPGGSIRDEEVVSAADDHDIAMVFTGRRHFRH